MSAREQEVLRFYRKHRIDDQLDFYRSRSREFDNASGQALATSAVLLGLASAVGALSGANLSLGWLWSILAVALPASATALAAYSSFYAFEQQSRIYGDALRAIRAASQVAEASTPGSDRGDGDRPDGDGPDASTVADLVSRTEDAFAREQGQWGQLTLELGVINDRVINDGAIKGDVIKGDGGDGVG